jgi:hypothetical protein
VLTTTGNECFPFFQQDGCVGAIQASGVGAWDNGS